MTPWTPHPDEAQFHDASRGGGAEDAAVAERQLALLGRLAEIGLALAEAMERQVLQGAPEASSDQAAPLVLFNGDLALSFSRVARGVRMTIALQARLIGERRGQDQAALARARVAGVAGRPARKARVERIVERIAWTEFEDDDAAIERVVGEAAERLEDADLYGDILRRPVSDLVDQICRDLDLSPDWPQLAQEAWAQAEIASGAVGEPLAALSPVPQQTSPPGSSRGPMAEAPGSSPHLRAERCLPGMPPRPPHPEVSPPT